LSTQDGINKRGGEDGAAVLGTEGGRIDGGNRDSCRLDKDELEGRGKIIHARRGSN